MSGLGRQDGAPRLCLLQWVGPGLLWLATFAIGLMQAPLFTQSSYYAEGYGPTIPIRCDFWALLFYSPFLIGLLAALVGAFRALAAARQRSEFRALMDLGAPRRGLVRGQVRLGLIHGAAAALSGSVLGSVVAQGVAGFGGDFNSVTAWTLLTIAGLSIVATTLAYWLVGRWITGGTRRTTSDYDIDAAAGVAAVPARKSRLRRFAVPLGLTAFVVVSTVVTPRLSSSSTVSPGVVTAWTLAYGLVLAVGVPMLVVWAGTRVATWLSHLAGRALLHGGTAARIAGDGLTRPTPARAVAIGAVGLVLGGTLMIAIILNAMGARNDAGMALTPVRIVSTGVLSNRDLLTDKSVTATATGWEQRGLDPALVAALEADDRLIVVTAGMLTAHVAAVDPTSIVKPDTLTFLAVSPKELDRVSTGAARALYFDGAVAMGGGASPSVLTANGASTDATAPRVAGPFAALPREWAEAHFGTGVTSAVLLYDAPGGSVTTAIVEYDLTGLHVRDFDVRGGSSGPVDRAGVLAVSGTLLMLAVGLVVALSLSIQKTRGHDYATMSALGASRSALRWGTAIESAVVVAAGAAIGIVLGGVWGLGLAVSADGVSWGLAWKGVRFDLGQAPWGTVASLTLASIAAAAAASVMARARRERLTPAEQLREAIKEGSL